MEKMKAAICTKYGPPDVFHIVEYNKPVPKDDEVLIKIYAASVTNSDIFIRSSNIPLRFRIPMRLMIGITRPRNEILGEVLSGEIVKIGSKIRRFHVGDQVYGLTGFSLGAYADYKCMKESDSKQGCVAIKPRNISFEEATSAAYGGLLALQFLEKGNIQPNQKVLVYGASGTSGTIAVQYAKSLGAEVTAVCSTANIQFIESLGADKTLDYTDKESISRIEKYDFILDSVGKARTSKLKEACQLSLTHKGQLASIDDGALILSSERLDRIRGLVESKVITPINDRCFLFEQIVDAYRYVELGHKRGNVAITINKIL
ncbi:MAG: NAD(P)-dependent alcohol dehydrogenase [Ignavibacteriales bacterium]|nr:NAD(P)-dependent alcohol dehydrogenase [Ignavibacteriales bacterium]